MNEQASLFIYNAFRSRRLSEPRKASTTTASSLPAKAEPQNLCVRAFLATYEPVTIERRGPEVNPDTG